MTVEKGQRIRDNGKNGTVNWGEDPHNIHVIMDDGEIRFYCIVKDCKCYNGKGVDIKPKVED